MDKDYESIKSKLKKLLALAEGGVGGEAHNARILGYLLRSDKIGRT